MFYDGLFLTVLYLTFGGGVGILQHTVKNMSEWTAIIDDLAQYLQVQKELGERDVPISAETLRLFRSGIVMGKAVPAAVAQPVPVQIPAPNKSDSVPEVVVAPVKDFAKQVEECTRCNGHLGRNKILIGRGKSVLPDVLFLTDLPEDGDMERGEFYSGICGQFMDKVVEAMGYARGDVYFTAMCKCRPVDAQRISMTEMLGCSDLLKNQIAQIQPRVIVALGAAVLKGLFQGRQAVSAQMLGKWMEYENIPLMPTYHPDRIAPHPEAAVSARRIMWANMKLVLEKLGR